MFYVLLFVKHKNVIGLLHYVDFCYLLWCCVPRSLLYYLHLWILPITPLGICRTQIACGQSWRKTKANNLVSYIRMECDVQMLNILLCNPPISKMVILKKYLELIKGHLKSLCLHLKPKKFTFVEFSNSNTCWIVSQPLKTHYFEKKKFSFKKN